jgi:hypothetical protein
MARIMKLNTAVPQQPLCTHTTMLELVHKFTQQTDDYRKVVAVVAQLVNDGQVQLVGTFKHSRRIDT